MPDKSLLREARSLAKAVAEALVRQEDVHPLIESCGKAVYLKDHDGRIVASNSAYARLFHDGQPLLGRAPERFLDAVTLELEQLSDQLIAAGAEQVIFDYGVRLKQSATERRHRAQFRVVKLSLRGRRLVNLASLAIVQNVGTFHPPAGSDLQQAWDRFSNLTPRTQECGVLLAHGFARAEIARRLQLSTRTVNAERRQIFETLGLDNSHQLAILLSRIQDAGHADLGF